MPDTKDTQYVDLSAQELQEMVKRLDANNLSSSDREILKTIISNYAWIREKLAQGRATIKNLKNMLFGKRSEKSKYVMKDRQKAAKEETSAEESSEEEPEGTKSAMPAIKKQGHGRYGASAYKADKIMVCHPDLKAGDNCPEHGCYGKLYVSRPATIIRLQAQGLFTAKHYELENLRCALCGTTYKTPLPEALTASAKQKHSYEAISWLGFYKYYAGLPFKRIETIQNIAGLPLPDATQWDLMKEMGEKIEPIYNSLITLSSEAELLHADDTRCQILDVAPENIKTNAKGKPRTGQYTTGLVCKSGQNTIHLFMSGNCYAGENVGQVLNKRSSEKEMMYMADALSMNKPQVLSVALLAKIIIIYCLTHARRQFVKLLEIFPQEARYVVELIGKIYKNEAHCQKESFSPLERLSYHQQHSTPLLEEWHRWMHRQFTEHIIEPNSSLGGAIKYVLKRWHELTQFTRVAGAPLDNNLVERALRIPIRLRKSAYFYKTERGAMVGDRMMSLIYTCIAADEEPIGYLTALQENIKAVHESPTCWLPWNYRAQLAAVATGDAAIEVGAAA